MRTLSSLACALAIAAVAAAPAAATKMRYTLTVTAVGQVERHSHGESFLPFTVNDLSWYVWDDDHYSTATYVARSVRPFWLQRSDLLRDRPFFAFTTKVAGSGSLIASGTNIASGANSDGAPWSCAGWYHGVSDANSPVAGTVRTMSLNNPVRLVVQVGSTRGNDFTNTYNAWCTGVAPTPDKVERGGSFGKGKVYTRLFNLRKAFGHTFTLTHTSTAKLAGETTRGRITFQFTPVAREVKRERWQIDVRGWDRESWGARPTLGAGVWVERVHRTTLVIEDGRLRATGKVLILQKEPFSTPPGVFRVDARTKTYPEYKIPIVRRLGTRVEMRVNHDPGSTYRLDFAPYIAGPEALDIMRRYRVPGAEEEYRRMSAPGAIPTVTTYLDVPNSYRVVFPLKEGVYTRESKLFSDGIPCSQLGVQGVDCFLRRGGEQVVVRRLG